MTVTLRRLLALWMPALLMFVLGLAAGALHAQPLAEPRTDWFSADSAHFRVHYRAGHRAQAERVAQAAEGVYPRVTEALQWKPRTRTEIVLYSEYDIANGFATPLPYSYMGVFLSPPDDGQLLDNSTWLDLLLVHEFTHVVHLDKVRGAPRVLQSIFGNVPWFIPNVFQPTWMVEGVAVFAESEPAAGKGRLMGPYFEAWLRAERSRGFVSLRELNADGRRLPLAKQYLYGAYFMEFVNRRYGNKAIGAIVEQYSGNIVPRLHSAPWAATGKMMDTLWEEFVADLAQQVDARSAALKATPEAVGEAIGSAQFSIDAIATLPGQQGWLAVAGDGVNGTHLVRITRSGTRERVARVNAGTRLAVAPDGAVLLAQPDICNTLYYAYDLYRLEGSSLRRLTHCAHLRRAVPAGNTLLALELKDGATRLVRLAADGSALQPMGTGASGSGLQPLWAPADGTELLDLAATPDGRTVHVVARNGGDWRLVAIDLTQAQAVPRTLVRRTAPIQALRSGADGAPEMVLAEGGVPNVWRLQGGELQRLTHSHTGVLHHAGSAADGALASVVIAPEGSAVTRLAQPVVLQRLAAVSDAPAPAAAPAAPAGTGLQAERPYSALRSVYPRSWFPAITADHGLTAYGASTSGGDALGWHRYAALAQVETSQKELTGTLEYQFVGSHGIALQRELVARTWRTDGNSDEILSYDRRTQVQWLSLVPFLRLERQLVLGVGAAGDWSERVDVPSNTTTRRRDERLVAALASLDFGGGDWFSEGRNRGAQASLLVEGYKPLQGGDALRYDGTVVRADLRAYLGIGRSVLALRATEARARNRTEPFQLGGAGDNLLQLGPVLNERELSLRGYRGDEPGLAGQNARVVSVEARVPIADIDRHGMVPPFGINRLSLAAFFDIGGTWGAGRSGPAEYSRGVGVELLGEVRLLYALGLRLRVGVAQGLDVPAGQSKTRGYLTAGRSF
jgi:hypothetical protein